MIFFLETKPFCLDKIIKFVTKYKSNNMANQKTQKIVFSDNGQIEEIGHVKLKLKQHKQMFADLIEIIQFRESQTEFVTDYYARKYQKMGMDIRGKEYAWGCSSQWIGSIMRYLKDFGMEHKTTPNKYIIPNKEVRLKVLAALKELMSINNKVKPAPTVEPRLTPITDNPLVQEFNDKAAELLRKKQELIDELERKTQSTNQEVATLDNQYKILRDTIEKLSMA